MNISSCTNASTSNKPNWHFGGNKVETGDENRDKIQQKLKFMIIITIIINQLW